MQCTVFFFVLPRLLICLSKHALGLALSHRLKRHRHLVVVHNQMSMAFQTMKTAVVSDAVSLMVKLGYTQKLV